MEVLLTLAAVSGGYALASAPHTSGPFAARLASVGLPTLVLRIFRRPRERGGILLLTWGGPRGGPSVALALSPPIGGEHDSLLTLTHAVVAFSILIQGTALP